MKLFEGTGRWLLLFAFGWPAVTLAESANESLLDLSLEELMSVEVTSASLIGATPANSASWMTLLDENSWRRQGARRTFDALASQPATLVMPSPAGGDMVVIRGYTRTTSGRGVAVVLDDVPLTDFARGSPTILLPNINLFALSSMDLIQGSGSALYGSDAFHGVIGLHSYQGDAANGSATLLAGSDRYYDGGVRDGFSLGDHHHASVVLAGNGQGNQHQDYSIEVPGGGDPLSGEHARRYDTGTAILHVGSDDEDATSYQFSYYRHRYDTSGYWGNGLLMAPSLDEGSERTDLEMGRVSVRHRFTDQRSLSLLGYAWQLDNIFAVNVAAGGGAVLGTLSQDYEQVRRGALATYRDAIAPLNTRWALAVGHDTLRIPNANSQLRGQDGTLLSAGPDSVDGAKRSIHSVMFEADSDLVDGRWHLVWGGRLDDYSDFGSEVSPRAGIIFHPTSQHSFKLIYNEAFRAPSASEMLGNGNQVSANPDLQPEDNRVTEFIWMYQDAVTTAQLGVFKGDWHNGIVTMINGSSITYENQERNQSQGIEASVSHQWQPWRFDLGGSWVESRNQTRDEDYGAFPRYMLNLGVGYNAAALRTDFYLLQRMMLDMTAEAAGAYLPSNADLPHFWRTDFTATWHAKPALEVMLVIRNLFDRDNYLPSVTSPGGVEDECFSVSAGVRYDFQ